MRVPADLEALADKAISCPSTDIGIYVWPHVTRPYEMLRNHNRRVAGIFKSVKDRTAETSRNK